MNNYFRLAGALIAFTIISAPHWVHKLFSIFDRKAFEE